MLRPDPSSLTNLIAVTYVPSTAPVRQKMLFASTRNTLTRDLGLEKFGDSLFATDDYEILDPEQWKGRGKNSDGSVARSEDILSTEERELQGVKRAEEEERHGTQGRDLMGKGGSGSRLAMKITEDARSALASLSGKTGDADEGVLVQLGIEIGSETLQLLSSSTGVAPGEFLSGIPGDRPSYAFYRYPGTPETVFVYTCPGASKVKERMVYASTRSSVLHVAGEEGVDVTKRLEQGDVGEITETRLQEEVGVGGAKTEAAVSSKGFARPKRPGKR